MRDRLLNETPFLCVDHTGEALAGSVRTYNTGQPHVALGYLTPTAFAAQLIAAAKFATNSSGPSWMKVGGQSTDT